MSERYHGNEPSKHGLENLLKRVKEGLTSAAKNLTGQETETNVRGYLPLHDDGHRIVLGHVMAVKKKFQEDPNLKPCGWEELWLPNSVENQGWRVTSAQADRYFDIKRSEARRRLKEEGAA